MNDSTNEPYRSPAEVSEDKPDPLRGAWLWFAAAGVLAAVLMIVALRFFAAEESLEMYDGLTDDDLQAYEEMMDEAYEVEMSAALEGSAETSSEAPLP